MVYGELDSHSNRIVGVLPKRILRARVVRFRESRVLGLKLRFLSVEALGCVGAVRVISFKVGLLFSHI
jgi:hypothetical protein